MKEVKEENGPGVPNPLARVTGDVVTECPSRRLWPTLNGRTSKEDNGSCHRLTHNDLWTLAQQRQFEEQHLRDPHNMMELKQALTHTKGLAQQQREEL